MMHDVIDHELGIPGYAKWARFSEFNRKCFEPGSSTSSIDHDVERKLDVLAIDASYGVRVELRIIERLSSMCPCPKQAWVTSLEIKLDHGLAVDEKVLPNRLGKALPARPVPTAALRPAAFENASVGSA